MTVTSNDALVYDAYDGRTSSLNRSTRSALLMKLYCEPLNITFDDSYKPTFSIPTLPYNDLTADNRFYRQVMRTMAIEGAEYIYLVQGDAQIFGRSVDAHMRAEYKRRVQLGGEKHFLAQLIQAMIRDKVMHRLAERPMTASDVTGQSRL